MLTLRRRANLRAWEIVIASAIATSQPRCRHWSGNQRRDRRARPAAYRALNRARRCR